MARSAVARPRYRTNILPAEMRKGMRVRDIRSGFVIYESEAIPYRGGLTDGRRGPRFDPKTNRNES